MCDMLKRRDTVIVLNINMKLIICPNDHFERIFSYHIASSQIRKDVKYKWNSFVRSFDTGSIISSSSLYENRPDFSLHMISTSRFQIRNMSTHWMVCLYSSFVDRPAIAHAVRSMAHHVRDLEEKSAYHYLMMVPCLFLKL